jgi:hypothetical protein
VTAHDWRRVAAPNGDCGYQCQRCRLTCITVESGDKITCPPPPPIPTLGELLAKVRAVAERRGESALGGVAENRALCDVGISCGAKPCRAGAAITEVLSPGRGKRGLTIPLCHARTEPVNRGVSWRLHSAYRAIG